MSSRPLSAVSGTTTFVMRWRPSSPLLKLLESDLTFLEFQRFFSGRNLKSRCKIRDKKQYAVSHRSAA